MISQSASAIRDEKDGEPLKTILEYAEENGLATGVVSNSSMADATPAACYAHSNDRSKHGEIFLLSSNPKGFFLMVESNAHGGDAKRNLERLVALDKIIRRTAQARRNDTLILFAADHSHDQRLRGGLRGENILPEMGVEGGAHTGEELLVTAVGPGRSRSRFFFPTHTPFTS